jgi:hypothetical protein
MNCISAVLVLKAKKSGRERKNSIRVKSNVKIRSVSNFSLSMKRRITAPTIGKKINRDKIGMPKIDMNMTPFRCHRFAVAYKNLL